MTNQRGQAALPDLRDSLTSSVDFILKAFQSKIRHSNIISSWLGRAACPRRLPWYSTIDYCCDLIRSSLSKPKLVKRI